MVEPLRRPLLAERRKTWVTTAERSGERQPLLILPEALRGMPAAAIRCVVGIDVAKETHVVCALEAPSGTVRQRATRLEASAQGYAQLVQWLQTWGDPDVLLIGLEAKGVMWEPLYEAVTQAGYSILVLNPRQTCTSAASLGLRAKTDGIDAHTLARGLLAGYARASTLPSEAVQSLRTLTRARRDLVQSQSAARQRVAG